MTGIKKKKKKRYLKEKNNAGWAKEQHSKKSTPIAARFVCRLEGLMGGKRSDYIFWCFLHLLSDGKKMGQRCHIRNERENWVVREDLHLQ